MSRRAAALLGPARRKAGIREASEREPAFHGAVRILFVENHQVFARTVVTAFLDAHEVVIRPSIEAARVAIEAERTFDVVLVDYDLDDGKGDALVRMLRRRGYDGRVIAASAHEEGNAALMRAGADAVCRKSDFARIGALLHATRSESPLLDRVRGALLGTLIGDALGRPFEGASTTDTERLAASLRRRVDAPRAWGHSDDGEMMLNVAESLCRRRVLDEAHLLGCLAEGHDPARGYGKGARAAFAVWAAGGTHHDAARALWADGSRGNGAAVRVAPIAACASSELVVADLARRSASATHAHQEALDGAAVVALAVHRALHRVERGAVVRGLDEECQGDFRQRLRDAWSRDVHRPGVLAIDTVPVALMSFARTRSFSDAVLAAIGKGGDTDSIGAMTGAIAGAFHGALEIPPSWVAALEPEARSRVDRYVGDLPYAV